MRSTRRTTNRKGFTLIELLIVVVIIGILAAVAIPKFSNTKSKAYVASMKSDLKNLVSTQESYFADRNAYAPQTEIVKDPYSFVVSQGTTITGIAGDATGWSAEVTNASAKQVCSVFGGTGTAATANQTKGFDKAAAGVDTPTDGVPYCKAVAAATP
jgi:prepilin-type N-terminal cleavage/methylation domain-containing protein